MRSFANRVQSCIARRRRSKNIWAAAADAWREGGRDRYYSEEMQDVRVVVRIATCPWLRVDRFAHFYHLSTFRTVTASCIGLV
jgi:hypothetical protein